MFNLFLQLWGGLYIINKVFFSISERSSNDEIKKKWRILAWFFYLIAFPAWVIVFALEHNWVAAFVELGGAPAMLVGLIVALRGQGTEPRWLDYVAQFSVIIGLGFSLYDFGGITSLNQILELCVSAGFLAGTYVLAKEKSSGYLWFILANISCSILMYRESFLLLMVQQILSLVFVIDAYWANIRQADKF